MPNFWESGPIILSLKVSKNNFSQIYGQKCGQKCHEWGQFCQNRSFLVKMVKIGPFWGPKWRHMSKFGVSGEIIFSLKVSKNYFSQVYGFNFGQKCHSWGQFCQNRSFLVKMLKIGSFWGQNDATGQNLLKVVTFFSKLFKLFQSGLWI